MTATAAIAASAPSLVDRTTAWREASDRAGTALQDMAAIAADRARASVRRDVDQAGFAPLAGFLTRNPRFAGYLLFPIVGHVLLALLIGDGAVGVIIASYFFFLSLLVINQAIADAAPAQAPSAILDQPATGAGGGS